MCCTIRFRFSVGGEVRFLSHLDLLRTMERALRRSGLPIAYSEGYSPRPKMSFGFALPVGVLSTAEYGDFDFTKDVSAAEFTAIYNEHLPRGLRVLRAKILPARTPALMSTINAAAYEIFIPGRSQAQFEARLRMLEEVDTFVIKRQTKRGERSLDIRPLLFEVGGCRAAAAGVCASARSALGSEGNLRIDELGLLLDFSHRDALITRTGQLIKTGENYSEPMGIEVEDE